MRQRTYLLALFTLAALLLAAARPAQAQLCTASTTSVAFGAYDLSSTTALDSSGSVSWVCLSSLTVTVTLSKGTSTTYTPRVFSGPSTAIYNLYTDSARTHIWGDGTGGSIASPPLLALLGSYPIYGRVPAGQSLQSGNYTDTVVVTLNF